MTKRTEPLDLDALMPEDAIVKWQGTEIKVKPPKLSGLLRIANLGSKLSDAKSMQPQEIEEVEDKIKAEIGELIPELKEATLNLKQLLGLVELLTEMAKPDIETTEDGKTLTPDTDPKVQ